MINLNILAGKTVAYTTLGCKLNFAETSSIATSLKELGVVKAEEGEKADICIVNTCTVTDVADSKGRQAINKIIRQNPNALVVVTGCYAQLKHNEIAHIPGVDIVVGAEHKSQIIPLIIDAIQSKVPIGNYEKSEDKKNEDFFPSCSHGDRTRYFLKVQDGCNYFCTYCTIPYARGRSRNASVSFLVDQAKIVADEGGKEIVLTGVNTGDFGRSTGESFLQLLEALNKVEGIRRYRISSIEPNLLTEDIIRFCAESEKFMPHFHIPLQSGSDEVLKLMRRRYDTKLYRNKIETVKRFIPDAFIGVDVMVGCRGERSDYFEQAFQFVDSLPISQLHVFSYSERPGTKALEIPYVVEPKVKHERSQRMIELSDRKTEEFYSQYINTTRPVLFEHSSNNLYMYGFTDNYIRVQAIVNPELFNTIQMVKLSNFNSAHDALISSHT